MSAQTPHSSKLSIIAHQQDFILLQLNLFHSVRWTQLTWKYICWIIYLSLLIKLNNSYKHKCQVLFYFFTYCPSCKSDSKHTISVIWLHCFVSIVVVVFWLRNSS